MISFFRHHLHFTVVPLMLMLTTPIGIVFVRHYAIHCRERQCLSYSSFTHNTKELVDFSIDSFSSLKFSWASLFHVFLFFVYAAISLIFFGGKKYNGPRTPGGHLPVYYNNGFRYYLLTTGITLTLFLSGQVSAYNLFVKLDYYQTAMLLSGFGTCILLLIKGHLWPTNTSTVDNGASGNIIFDVYWGIELYPRITERLDIKQLTNCRFGMMLWQVMVLLCTFAHYEHYGFSYSMTATAILQSVYVAKFFWWEDGYMQSIDIIVDRAGYYLCWGCICFVPYFYAVPSFAMIGRCPEISFIHFILLVGIGLLCIFLNYWSDYQRQLARKTDGNCTIWFRPATVIRAKYVDSDGNERRSLLLASGFWSLSRHCNYVFEILAALFFALPAGANPLAYTYTTFLTILLFHRSFRDEEKCSKKYGKFWQQYCEKAKYKIIPFIW